MSDLPIIERLLGLIQAQGITQKNLSDKLHISTGNISDWKTGRSAPKADALVKIADYFRVSTDYLLGRTDVPAPVGQLRREEEELLALYHDLNEEGQGELLKQAKILNSCGLYIKPCEPGLGEKEA